LHEVQLLNFSKIKVKANKKSNKSTKHIKANSSNSRKEKSQPKTQLYSYKELNGMSKEK
jgi:hypothetical protein